MQMHFSFTTLFILLLLHSSATADRNFIEKTCKSTPNYDLCLNILLADPKSETAGDVTALALIGVAAIKQKAEEITQQVADLQKTWPELREALDYCAHVYQMVVHYDVGEASRALSFRNPSFAEDMVVDCGLESEVCEGGFGGQASPMTDSNHAMNDMASVVRALVRMLL